VYVRVHVCFIASVFVLSFIWAKLHGLTYNVFSLKMEFPSKSYILRKCVFRFFRIASFPVMFNFTQKLAFVSILFLTPKKSVLQKLA
jgi:hypothetical protein